MTGAVLDRPLPADPGTGRPGRSGRGRCLDELISGAWTALAQHRRAVCPVCQGTMTPVEVVEPPRARCHDCSSEIT